MTGLVNIGLLLAAIKAKGWKSFKEAAAHCGTSESTFTKLKNGQIPERIDALFRVCDGCGIKIEELIRATTHKSQGRSGRDAVHNRWPDKPFVQNET